MDRLHVIYDCDPGVDDYIGWILLARNENVDFRGVTTVPGNKNIEAVTRNALGIAELFHMPHDFPIAKGAELCMMQKPLFESGYHGPTGLCDIVLDTGSRKVIDKPAWEFIRDEAVSLDGELTIIAVGPLTNIGIALMKYPYISKLIKDIYIMGGSSATGNISPLAESNIYHDPEAAKIVFESGINLHMAGLECFDGCGIPTDLFSEILYDTEPSFNTVTNRISEHLNGDAPYDAVVVAWALNNDLFESVKSDIVIETESDYMNGVTVCDLNYSKFRYGGEAHTPVDLAVKADSQKWIEAVNDAIECFKGETR